MSADLPAEAGGLFASEAFVEERNLLVRELRAAGKPEQAAVVASLRKPPRLVVLVNRAARELPLQAKAAVGAAERLAAAQAAGDRRRLQEAAARLERAVDQLAGRAAESGGDRASVVQVLRAALTSPEGRQELAEGRLRELPESTGFEALAGLAITVEPRPTKSEPAARPARPSREKQRQLERRLAEAKRELEAAERAEAQARRAVEAARGLIEAIEAELDRLARAADCDLSRSRLAGGPCSPRPTEREVRS